MKATNWDELPVMLEARDIKGKILDINLPAVYLMMRAAPHIRIGRRILVPRDSFKKWLEEKANVLGSEGF